MIVQIITIIIKSLRTLQLRVPRQGNSAPDTGHQEFTTRLSRLNLFSKNYQIL